MPAGAGKDAGARRLSGRRLGRPFALGFALAVLAGFAAFRPVDGQARPDAGRRGWIGVRLDLARESRGAGPATVLVVDVYRGGPADVAGIRPGDILAPSRPLGDYGAWLRALGSSEPGDTVRLRLLRNGEARLVLVLAGRRPVTAQAAPLALYRTTRNRVFRTADSLLADALRLARAPLDRPEDAFSFQARGDTSIQIPWGLLPEFMEAARNDLVGAPFSAVGAAARLPIQHATTGAALRDLPRELRGHFGVEAGVLATSVPPGSPAARAGLKAGDIVVFAGGAPVATLADLHAVLASASAPLGAALVRRGQRVSLPPPLAEPASRPATRRPSG